MEADDTYASHDARRFTELAEPLNFPMLETYFIPNVLEFDKMPAFELRTKIARLLARAAVE